MPRTSWVWCKGKSRRSRYILATEEPLVLAAEVSAKVKSKASGGGSGTVAPLAFQTLKACSGQRRACLYLAELWTRLGR